MSLIVAAVVVAVVTPALYAVTLAEEVTREFTCGPAPRVRIVSFNGDVEIRAGQPGVIRFTCRKLVHRLTGLNADQALGAIDVEMKRDGDEIRLEVKGPRRRLWQKCTSASVLVELPPDAWLVANTSNGDIVAEDLRNYAELTTSNGRIELQDVGGRVVARTSNGPIEADMESGFLSAETSNNRIDVNGDDVEVQAKTSNAAIEIELDGGEVMAETSSGKITIEGRASQVTARTSNGAIDIELDDEPGRVTAWTSNGSIAFEGSLKERSDFETSNGAILLELADSFPLEIEARTNNGSIVNRIDDLQVRRQSGSLLDAFRPGSPSAFIRATTSNGAITLRPE